MLSCFVVFHPSLAAGHLARVARAGLASLEAAVLGVFQHNGIRLQKNKAENDKTNEVEVEV